MGHLKASYWGHKETIWYLGKVFGAIDPCFALPEQLCAQALAQNLEGVTQLPPARKTLMETFTRGPASMVEGELEFKNAAHRRISGPIKDKANYLSAWDTVAGELYKVALYTLGSSQNAFELMQLTFTDGYRQLNNLQKGNDFRLWMMKVLCARAGRLAASQLYRAEDLLHFACEKSTGDFDPHPYTALFDSIGSLDLPQRQVVALLVCGGYTIKGIARILGIGKGTVSSKLYISLANLRKVLAEQSPTKSKSPTMGAF